LDALPLSVEWKALADLHHGGFCNGGQLRVVGL
jgi:hypothetical protein